MKKAVIYICIPILIFLLWGEATLAQTPTPTPEEEAENKENEEEDAEDEDEDENITEKEEELKNKIDELEDKVSELQEEQESLSSQIEIVDSQVALSELRVQNTRNKIAQLQEEIGITEEKIGDIEGDMSLNTKALMNRAVAIYESGKVEAWQILLTSDSVSNFIRRLAYLKIIQENDKKALLAAEQAKVNYSNQQNILGEKVDKEIELEEELEQYNIQLEEDKNTKRRLLEETKGSEEEFQRLLAQARAEYAAIQGIISGDGTETKVGDVEKGEVIASVISGPSCNSSGTHLDFMVRKDGAIQNPFNYLKSGVEIENCSGSSCGSNDGDSINATGDWDWPLEPKIRLTQGHGETWAVRNTWVSQIYSYHNGIDIQGSSLSVKAVDSGTLYRGSYAGQSCRLPYVKVEHEDNTDTLYLHVNY